MCRQRWTSGADEPVDDSSRLADVFNFSGSEIVFLLLLALIVLGPEKLPEAIRKFGKTYAEFKKVTTGFQTELKQALDEPMREMRETADLFKQAASLDVMNPMQEATSALRSITDPTPAVVSPQESTGGDPDGTVGGDPDGSVDESLDAAAGDAPPRAPSVAQATTAPSDEHKPFESTVISGGQTMRSLDGPFSGRSSASVPKPAAVTADAVTADAVTAAAPSVEDDEAAQAAQAAKAAKAAKAKAARAAKAAAKAATDREASAQAELARDDQGSATG